MRPLPRQRQHSRPKRPHPLWYHLLSNAVPVLYLLAFALLAAMVYRLAVWLLFGVKVWF